MVKKVSDTFFFANSFFLSFLFCYLLLGKERLMENVEKVVLIFCLLRLLVVD